MPRLATILTLAAVGLATAAPAAHAAPVSPSNATGAKCSAATYAPMHGISGYRQNPHLSFWRHLNVAPHTAKTGITWSVPATARLTAHASRSGGSHGASAWIWRGVKHHFGRPVAVGGERSPRLAKSGGTFAVHNATSKTKHDIEFNGITRFSGRYFTTHCGHANSRGIGRVVRDNGSWVTFSKFGAAGLVQCGIGKGTDAIAKAALKHCT